jgi:hypothetical protein
MDDEIQCDRLKLLEDRILGNLEDIRKRIRCKWCQNPNLPVSSKGLCSSCYRWYRMQRKLSKEVEGLPARAIRDPHWNLRHELDVVNCAIELCKGDGDTLETQLNQTDPADIEKAFQILAGKMLGPRRGSPLFQGTKHFFEDFSPKQRVWLWYLLSRIVSETSRRDRLSKARSVNIRSKHSEAGEVSSAPPLN